MQNKQTVTLTIKVPSHFPLAALAMLAKREGYKLRWVKPRLECHDDPRLYQVIPERGEPIENVKDSDREEPE